MPIEKLPTHDARAILIDRQGRKAQTQKVKFHAESYSPEDTEKAGRDAIEKSFCNPTARNPYRIESLSICKLPAVKLGAKLNSQHDYITLTATFLDGVLRFTTAYGGEKISGDFVGNPVLDTFYKKWATWIKQKGKNMGERMEILKTLALESKTMEEFVEKIPA